MIVNSRTYEKNLAMHCSRSSKSGTASEPGSLPCDSTYREQRLSQQNAQILFLLWKYQLILLKVNQKQNKALFSYFSRIYI